MSPREFKRIEKHLYAIVSFSASRLDRIDPTRESFQAVRVPEGSQGHVARPQSDLYSGFGAIASPVHGVGREINLVLTNLCYIKTRGEEAIKVLDM